MLDVCMKKSKNSNAHMMIWNVKFGTRCHLPSCGSALIYNCFLLPVFIHKERHVQMCIKLRFICGNRTNCYKNIETFIQHSTFTSSCFKSLELEVNWIFITDCGRNISILHFYPFKFDFIKNVAGWTVVREWETERVREHFVLQFIAYHSSLGLGVSSLLINQSGANKSKSLWEKNNVPKLPIPPPLPQTFNQMKCVKCIFPHWSRLYK